MGVGLITDTVQYYLYQKGNYQMFCLEVGSQHKIRCMAEPTTYRRGLCLIVFLCESILECIGLDENIHYKEATAFQYLPHRGIWDTTVSS